MLFDKLFHKLDGFKIALALYSFMVFGASDDNSDTPEVRRAKEIREREEGRAMTMAFEALEALGEPKTLSELLLALDILPYAGAGGSKTTIRYTNKLLAKDYIDDSKKPKYRPNVLKNNYFDFYYATIMRQLGKSYEYTYDLEQALSAYMTAFDYYTDKDLENPSSSVCLVPDVVRCLNRLGRMDDSIAFLLKIKETVKYKSPYLINEFGSETTNHWKVIIDENLEDAIKKKERNYVYRPRPRKEKGPLSFYTYHD